MFSCVHNISDFSFPELKLKYKLQQTILYVPSLSLILEKRVKVTQVFQV